MNFMISMTGNNPISCKTSHIIKFKVKEIIKFNDQRSKVKIIIKFNGQSSKFKVICG